VKILVLSVRDTGGTGYTLAHAINKICPEHQTVNIRGMNTFLDYPTIVDMADYNRTRIREMVYKADVILFLGAMQPFFEALRLRKNKLRDAKKILLCMGSEWRLGRDQLMAQADKLLGNYKIVLGGADMFLPLQFTAPDGSQKEFPEVDPNEVSYLPVVRSFQEITEKYYLSPTDQAALQSFGVPKKKTIFTHAPTSEINKGSILFYRVATRAMQACPNMVFATIRQQPWVACLATLSRSNVLFDQAPPFPTAYGALSVEAAIFHLPSFSQVDPRCREFIKHESGLDTPYITFEDEEDLFNKVVTLAREPKVREMFGELNYKYCKALHDEKPVVDRFMTIVEKMN